MELKRMETEWPWERKYNLATLTPDDKNYALNYRDKQPMFRQICYENEYLDISTKITAIKAASFVVSLAIYSGDKEISQGSGTIIEEDGTILTSTRLVRCPLNKNKVVDNLKVNVHLWNGKFYEAELLAHDFYYGIAVVKIKQDAPRPLPTACLRNVDDCISVDPNELHIDNDKGFQPRPCSNTYNLVPGDKVIALGRYFIKPYDLMAAPGEFSVKRFYKYDDGKEFFRATCLITEVGIGGPLINCRAEVIGISLYEYDFTPFVPVNVALKWWEWKKDKKLHRQPLLGMELANLYTTHLQDMEKVLQKLSNDFIGVVVEEVKQGSSADIAGLRPNDIIVKCCGKPVRSYLEFFDMMWDKAGGSVELAVLRSNANAQLDLSMEVVVEPAHA